ncbi:MAG: hypothetical protein QXR65_07380, partial [Candidatus Bathyarchaeia archaeon]
MREQVRSGDSPNEDLAKYPYNEDEQVNYIAQYCNMLNRAKISGAFLNQFDDERLKGYGLYKATIPPILVLGQVERKASTCTRVTWLSN